MGNPINNLGDYNLVRIDLQAEGGSKEELYKSIGDIAVAKAAPILMAVGGLIAIGIIGGIQYGKKAICFMKERKQKIKNEPEIKKEFFKALEE
ncbi:MAG: hypothetical protein FWE82_05635 [Defluviitaleaceae bacterium]|nr:hypothetical protein [Defluviitaleaceae bacterium]